MTMYWNSNIFFLLQRNQSAWNPTVKKKKRKETTIYFKNSNSECNNVNTKRKGEKNSYATVSPNSFFEENKTTEK